MATWRENVLKTRATGRLSLSDRGFRTRKVLMMLMMLKSPDLVRSHLMWLGSAPLAGMGWWPSWYWYCLVDLFEFEDGVTARETKNYADLS